MKKMKNLELILYKEQLFFSNQTNRTKYETLKCITRCNYCNSSLGLKNQDGAPNQWLSKMKPVLSCCPTCRKPLPRCSICMLSLGVLNPFVELTKDRSKNAESQSHGSLPFAEWFTWCMRCKHGGHAHHLVGWFSKHSVCPVSDCDCPCQFDGSS